MEGESKVKECDSFLQEMVSGFWHGDTEHCPKSGPIVDSEAGVGEVFLESRQK
jgi:hypothetical protein